MKTRRYSCAARIALVVGLILAGMATAVEVEAGGAGGITLELVPSTLSATPGQMVTVDVVVSGLGDFASPAVGAFDFDLTFDDSLFMLTGVSFGPLLGDSTMGEAIIMTTPAVAGSFNANEVSLLTPAQLVALQPSSFTLLTATYEVIGGGGAGVFDLSVLAIGDEDGAALAVNAVIPATVATGPPTSPIDIPTLSQWSLLLLTLVLLLAGLGRLRRVRS